jgi:hypothetical protein
MFVRNFGWSPTDLKKFVADSLTAHVAEEDAMLQIKLKTKREREHLDTAQRHADEEHESSE